jgi:hypothetical protein
MSMIQTWQTVATDSEKLHMERNLPVNVFNPFISQMRRWRPKSDLRSHSYEGKIKARNSLQTPILLMPLNDYQKETVWKMSYEGMENLWCEMKTDDFLQLKLCSRITGMSLNPREIGKNLKWRYLYKSDQYKAMNSTCSGFWGFDSIAV